MFEISNAAIVSAVGIKLRECFPGVSWYKEAVGTLKYPHFFVQITNSDVTQVMKNRYKINYLINVRYRAAADPSTIPNLNEKLDETALALMDCLGEIKLETVPFRMKNQNAQKPDNVLQYMTGLTIRAKKPEEAVPYMMVLDENYYIKEDKK